MLRSVYTRTQTQEYKGNKWTDVAIDPRKKEIFLFLASVSASTFFLSTLASVLCLYMNRP